jgi:hypothetical protein
MNQPIIAVYPQENNRYVVRGSVKEVNNAMSDLIIELAKHIQCNPVDLASVIIQQVNDKTCSKVGVVLLKNIDLPPT